MAGPLSFIGSVDLWAGSFAPVDWAFCRGQLLPIQSYQVLFSLLRTTFGGDGVTNFGLPDLQGALPVGAGQIGDVTYTLGDAAGSETLILDYVNMPMHRHDVHFKAAKPVIRVNNQAGGLLTPNGNYLGVDGSGQAKIYSLSGESGTALAGTKVTFKFDCDLAAAGLSAPIKIVPPCLVINFIIMIQNGQYPTPPEESENG